MPRFFCDAPLQAGQTLSLPEAAARHVQVLRHQPGQTITLFNGLGGEWQATIDKMGRQDVVVTLQSYEAIEREASRAVHLFVGMPANERMDWLVEKATELGVASIAPLHTAHSVLRLSGERAAKKQAHWQAIAASACEQCGRNRVPVVAPVQNLDTWLDKAQGTAMRYVLSLAEGSRPLGEVLKEAAPDQAVWFLSGPEGGLSAGEDARARAAGFVPVSLGARVLRAETAALAALALAAG